jgi:uncharacterized protein (DUF433 family)
LTYEDWLKTRTERTPGKKRVFKGTRLSVWLVGALETNHETQEETDRWVLTMYPTVSLEDLAHARRFKAEHTKRRWRTERADVLAFIRSIGANDPSKLLLADWIESGAHQNLSRSMKSK